MLFSIKKFAVDVVRVGHEADPKPGIEIHLRAQADKFPDEQAVALVHVRHDLAELALNALDVLRLSGRIILCFQYFSTWLCT